MIFKAHMTYETSIVNYLSVNALLEGVSKLPYSRKMWIVDSKVYSLYSKCLHERIFNQDESNLFIVVQSGEASKSLQQAMVLYEILAELQWTKADALVALGGGMVGDLTGYVAGTYLRGLPLEFIPTTLLSQLDSSVGGKVAVNTPLAKNQVGLYYPAKRVHIAAGYLETLPVDDFNSGLGELLKMMFLFEGQFDKLIFEATRQELEAEIQQWVHRALNYKIAVCEQDFLDEGDRLFLNFGHTIGHAIEAELGYGTISHGIAVALGMLMITGFLEKIGKTTEGTALKMAQFYKQLGVVLPKIAKETRGALVERMGHDKKRAGDTLTFVGIKTFGQPFLEPFPMARLSELKTYLEDEYDF